MATFLEIFEELKSGKSFRRPYKKANGTWKPNRYIKLEEDKIFLYERVQVGDKLLSRKVDGHGNGSDYIPVRWLLVDDWESWDDSESD